MNRAFWRVHALVMVPGSAVALALMVFWLGRSGALPEPIAIHWGWSLQPDGFTSIFGFIVSMLTLQGIIWIGILASEFVLSKEPFLRQYLGYVLLFVFWFLNLIFLTAVFAQLGSSDSSQVAFPWPVLLIILLVIALSIWLFLAYPQVVFGETIAIKLRGVTVMRIPTGQIESVSVGSVRPWDYGGWGMRIARNRIGFIPSAGEAVVLYLRGGEQVAIRSTESSKLARDLKNSLGLG